MHAGTKIGENWGGGRSHWLLVTFSFVLIGCCDYFGFGLTTLNQKALFFETRLEIALFLFLFPKLSLVLHGADYGQS